MNRILKVGTCGFYVLFSFLLMLSLASVAYGQSSASATIVGRVLDPQGAVVPGAKVTATNTATGVAHTVETTSSGDFTIPNLSPATYDVKAEATGFTAGEAKGVKLNVGDQQDVNFKLVLAGTTQSIVTIAEVPLIETTKTDVSSTVDDKNIERLPMIAAVSGGVNDFAQLALGAPGVKLDTSGLTLDLIGPGSINNRANMYNVDGGNITDQMVSGRDGVGASVDEIQEFQVLTNNYNAEYGQAGGLVINAVTKSGTNDIHGDGHMYFRGRNLGASNTFYNMGEAGDPRCPSPTSIDGCPRAPFHRKEGGFTLGGPFIKDKLFWFGSYELSRASTPLTITPPPSFAPVTIQQPVNNLLWSGKIEYKISDKHTLTARYNVDRIVQDNLIVQTGTNITPDSLTSNLSHVNGLNVGFVSSITPHLVNEARFLFYRTLTGTPDKTTIPGQQHANYYTGANFCCPQGGLQKRYQYIDNLTWTHGSHSLKTGFNISYFPWFSLFPQFHFGQYGDFTDPTTPTTFTIGFGPGKVTSKDNIYGFFAQDTWKIAHNLTMNYGLRYDYEAGAFKGGKINGPNGTCLQGNGIIPACSSDKNNFQPRLGFAYSPRQGWLVKASFAETTMLAFNNVVLDSLNFDGTTINTVTIDDTTVAGQAVLAAFPGTPSDTLLAPFAPNLTSFGRIRPISPNLKNPEIRSVNFSIQHEMTKTVVVEAQYIGQWGYGLFGERDVNYPTIIPDSNHPGFFYFGPRPDSRFTAIRMNENSRSSRYNGLLVSINKRFSNHVQFAGSYTWSHALTNGEDFFGLSEPADPRNIPAEMGPAFNDIRHAVNFTVLLDSGRVTNLMGLRWFTNDIGLNILGQLQSGRPYPLSTGTAGFADARFFGAGNETQQRPNVLPDGTISVAGIASFTGQNALFGDNAPAACIAAGLPAAQCNSIQNTFIAPGNASSLGAIDALTGDIVDFQYLSGNVGRDAARTAPFYKFDVSIHKTFKIPRAERVSLDLRLDAFNVFNHANYQGFNSNDVTGAMGLALDPDTGAILPTLFTCTSCMRPDGTYVGSGGQVLHLKDVQHGRISSSLLNPAFKGLGDPASADIPRTLQLSFHVRF